MIIAAGQVHVQMPRVEGWRISAAIAGHPLLCASLLIYDIGTYALFVCARQILCWIANMQDQMCSVMGCDGLGAMTARSRVTSLLQVQAPKARLTINFTGTNRIILYAVFIVTKRTCKCII